MFKLKRGPLRIRKPFVPERPRTVLEMLTVQRNQFFNMFRMKKGLVSGFAYSVVVAQLLIHGPNVDNTYARYIMAGALPYIFADAACHVIDTLNT